MTAKAQSSPQPITDQAHPVLKRPWLLLLGLVLVALNLRPALSSVAPLLNEVSASLGMSAAEAGLLTTLPVLCLGLFAPLAPILARRFGSERVVLVVLLTLASGLAVRSLFGEVGLFTGSLLAGASIGVIGVLLPGIVKRDFPHKAGAMTGVYTMALCLGAAIAAGSTVPLSQYVGDSWQIGLGFWLIPALIAALFWFPQAREMHGSHRDVYRVRGLLRDAAGVAGHAVHGPAIVAVVHCLRLAALDSHRSRPDADPGRSAAVRLDHRASHQRPGGALSGHTRQGSASGDHAGHVAHTDRAVRLPVRSARRAVGLGDPGGSGRAARSAWRWP
ncbi:Cyanate MFS transporter [Pseudomonas savastanoi]|nr:Cyanate transport protein CynX [Pseudomonas savastanoi]KPY66832.1 Cyanate MFS transporter [Pseudomonas savastanoi pv. savastanoi]RML83105.1 Cyanate MFS transporter [Pseudomonas savastanoi]